MDFGLTEVLVLIGFCLVIGVPIGIYQRKKQPPTITITRKKGPGARA